ncbi:MAG: hypothetical protein WCJ29_02015 [bacterium]
MQLETERRKKKYPEEARVFLRLLRNAVKSLEPPRRIIAMSEKCLAYGATRETVRTIIRNGFRKHISILANETELVAIAFVVSEAMRCKVDRRFLEVSLRTAMNRNFAPFLKK